MAYDPLNSARNRGATEFAGVQGLVQPKVAPQTGAVGLVAGHDPLTPQEKRRLVQAEIIASGGVMEDLLPTDEHYQAVVDLAARRRELFASGHTLDDAMGDQ